jgi:Zn-dependent protease
VYVTNNTQSLVDIDLGKLVDESQFGALLASFNIRPGYEIGIASGLLLSDSRRRVHLPMIDFIGRPSLERVRTICSSIANMNSAGAPYCIYSSGNSYHVYFGALIPEARWGFYLDTLATIPEIDQRWVQHSRHSRYGAVLRWTFMSGRKRFIHEVARWGGGMRSSLKLGSALGVPVFLHWSILLAVGGMIFSLGAAGVVLAIMLFASILAHEYAHVLAARKYGLPSTKIVLHYFGGAASLDLTGVTPKQEVIIAFAGPALSAAIAAAALLLDAAVASVASGRMLISGVTILTTLGVTNIAIVIFNMLPIFPMDGGRILRAALQLKFGHARATKMALNTSVILSAALVIIATAKLHGMLPIAILIFGVSLLLRHSHKDNDQML